MASKSFHTYRVLRHGTEGYTTENLWLHSLRMKTDVSQKHRKSYEIHLQTAMIADDPPNRVI